MMPPAIRATIIAVGIIAVAWASAVTVLLARIHGDLQRVSTALESWALAYSSTSDSRDFADAIRHIEANVNQIAGDVATIRIYAPYAARPR